MTEKTLRKNMWESAGYAGLALGLVSVVYMYINNFLGRAVIETPENASGLYEILGLVFWAAKFTGCIILMKFFMKKFSASYPEATNKDVMKMGIATALLSAFLYSAVQFADMAYFQADYYNAVFASALKEMPKMDMNTMNQIREIIDMIPQISFVINLLYCFVYGAILSMILSRNIPNNDPFANYNKPDEQ